MATAEIRTRASLDHKGFDVGIKKMQQSVSSWKNGQLRQIGGMLAGAFAISAVVNFGKEAFAASANLEDLADRTGLNTTQIQALTASAADYGATQEDVISGLIKLQTLQEEVAGGGGKSLEAVFLELGISAQEFGALSTEALVNLIAKSKVTSAALKDLFGKTGVKTFGGTFKEMGDAGLEGLAKSKAAQITSPEGIKAAGMLEDKMIQMKRAAQAKLVEGMTKMVSLTEKEKELSKKRGEEQIKLQAELAGLEAKQREQRRADFEESIRAEYHLKGETEKSKITVGAGGAADVFAAKGGFSGAQAGLSNRMMGLAERQLKELEIQTETERDISKKLDGG